ncbi:protein GLUTAMINE DUMPER 5 [Pistacia vera]|uniref:protein GLUTAMINE DUMPER 5 n=1 Tax=Pistacia vera TaxID=55513 RepID=UPI001263267E|nr:protein GLUTAMINE DUMPER 5 [Pistacia vera]
MRTLAKFNAQSTPATPTMTMSAAATATIPATEGSFSPPVMVAQQRSPWHSPVPYLFGGLAAMLGLIAFALLILACSYWRFSSLLDGSDQNGDRDLESGEKEQEGGSAKAVKVYEEKVLVIMAGDVKPTFLATPVCSKVSSFGDGKEMIANKEGEKVETGEKVKEMADEHEAILTTPHEENSRDNQESQRDQEQQNQ